MKVGARSCWLLLVSIFVAMLVRTSGWTAPPQEKAATRESILTAAANTFKKSFHVGEAVPLAFAIANSGPGARYVSSVDLKRHVLWIEVRDAEGKTVMGDPIPTPSKTPGDHYMEKEGKWVLMQPLWKLEGGSGVVLVIPDALQLYHKHLARGTYTLHPTVSASRYRKDSIVRREGLRYEYWAEAAALISQRTLEANVIKITIE